MHLVDFCQVNHFWKQLVNFYSLFYILLSDFASIEAKINHINVLFVYSLAFAIDVRLVCFVEKDSPTISGNL